MNELNLLPNQTKFRINQIKLVKNIKKYVWIVGIVWMVIVLCVFVGIVLTKQMMASEEKKIKLVESDLLKMSELVDMGDEIKYRTKQVGNILNGRFEYYSRFEKIKSFMPLESMMVNVKLGERSKVVNVTGTTSDNNAIDDLERIVEEINSGKMENFSNAKITSVNYLNGVWNYTMEVEVK